MVHAQYKFYIYYYLILLWDELMVSGPPLGYFPNPQKCWLIVKPEKERPAKEIFSETTINITTEGRKPVSYTHLTLPTN